MEIEEYYKLQDISRRRVREVSVELRRSLFYRIDWRDRLIAIFGPRGTGKTTLLLQHMREEFSDEPERALYVSLDNLWFETHSLYELADLHYKNGGTHLFVDEVHHLEKWQIIIKNLYDDYPGLSIVYTGSSLLQMDFRSGDLSRRQMIYRLPGLSFREYLYFEGVGDYPAVSLQELLHDHVRIAAKIPGEVRVLKHFAEYLRRGYYPFYREAHAGYDQRLMEVINQILESDYPALESINYSTVAKIKKMLYLLAQSCPQTPNMSELYRQLDTDRNQGLKMLYTLERANLLGLLAAESASLKNLSRPDKIYCDNTNIMYALTEEIDTGTRRETFFLNQIKAAGYRVFYPKQGDFFVDHQYLFEVGDRNKGFQQIRDIPDSYLAVDDEEQGHGNRIPLWMFGLLY